MPKYTIIRVRGEIARHYFQKSDLLYRFLLTYKYNHHKDYLQRQHSFVTRCISPEKIMGQIQDMYESQLIMRGNNIEISSGHNKIALHISKKQIKFCCETMQDAETLLFPALRKVYPYLFVVCEDYVNYGWISPISNKEQEKQEQVLYSYY